MRRSKIAALALAATMLTGAAAAGSYAYFTAKTEVTTPSNLVIRTGKMNLEVSKESAWDTQNMGTWDKETIESTSSELENGNTSFEQVKPGERFSKIYTITPKDSNLNQKVTFTGGDILPETNDFHINYVVRHNNGSSSVDVNKGDVINLAPTDEIEVCVYVDVKPSMTGENLGGEQDKLFDLSDNITPIEFQGAQINAQ
ncbi:hypothetical protein SAMN02745196_02780 [Clostridium collagenovorans DSM 3089]|uniref:SipW-cognate class signal peptide n=1 Tax=Clostridium collagenovorans DSM 3089 TaxID=1121306 RepID=A0A1M5YBN9_9CLOT|nr:hypothetical protein [Clostridium collagenovorans]SHI08913.1 hypothetical protein SAMN02745196_02780 [Clostridium collagenovorans DSM 3089]